MYDPELVRPMRHELTAVGFKELLTPADVDQFMVEKSGTAMVVINSVCGCAAGSARPGIAMALKNAKKPQKLGTVFAGMDKEATQKVRGTFSAFPPSSPSIALFKDGQVVHFVPRHKIEGRTPDMVSQDLIQAFNQHC